MNFPLGHPLSFPYQHQIISFTVQGDPQDEFCITCQHPLFSQRFNGGTKCFHPFLTAPFLPAPFLPDATDENYDFFNAMRTTILQAHRELKEE